MAQTKRKDDLVNRFKDLSEEEKRTFIKQIMPEFCRIALEDKELFQEMMPECMKMMSEMNFPMQEMMSRMMGKG